MTLARRADVELTWQGADVSVQLVPSLVGLTYTDNLSGTADDLTLDLEDRSGLLSGDWRPRYGDQVEARLKAEPWISEVSDLRLGLYSHDHASYSGPPKRVTLKCVSAALASGLRRHRKSKAWSGVTLRQIAEDMGNDSGFLVQWDADATATYRKRREQKDKSDLDFLLGECEEQGLALKVTEGAIVIFDANERELADPIGDIDLGGGSVLGWNFDEGKSDHYGRCRVRCFDPRTGKTIDAYFREPGDEGPTLEVKRTVATKGEAESLAKALLRRANQFASRGKLTVVGDPGLVAGVTFNLTGAYGFDGKFIIASAAHRPVAGYTTELDVRRCLEDY